jgi:RsiW-degrading membrane proteinase PrsW (M82 family)
MNGLGWQELVILLVIIVPLVLWIYGGIWLFKRTQADGRMTAGWLAAYILTGFLYGLGSMAVVAAYFLSRPKDASRY